MSVPNTIAELLARARLLDSTGQNEPAKAAYLELLSRDPTHFDALIELGNRALSTGHRSAARTAYRHAVHCHPHNPVGRVNLGNLYYQDGDLAAARMQYEAALAADGEFAEAHQGLARTLDQLGETEAAQPHWRRGFAGRALVAQRYRGTDPAVTVLLLVSVKLGNIATRLILDERIFKVTALYTEYFDPSQPLPPHVVVFNAVSDADLCAAGLDGAEAVLELTAAPVINAPRRVRMTSRADNARRLGALPGVVAPHVRRIDRQTLRTGAGLTFPLLLRAPGFHMGMHFLRVERTADLEEAAAMLPGEELLVIDYLDARGRDGMARKYRVMIIGGTLHPLHLAISSGWKVHYFSAEMANSAAHRAEEQRFLEDMPAVLGARAMSALTLIGETLRLDYAGIDFGLDADGSVLLFEANATMAIVAPDADPIWDYRRASIARSIEATRRMVRDRGRTHPA